MSARLTASLCPKHPARRTWTREDGLRRSPRRSTRVSPASARLRASRSSFEERRRGDYGSYQRKERRITLNAALPATEKATTLAHELAHHLLHGVAQADGIRKQTREIEAEGAAFVVCAAFGLDTSRFTFAYVANYAGEPETLKAALERIQGAARRLIEAVEDSMKGGRS